MSVSDTPDTIATSALRDEIARRYELMPRAYQEALDLLWDAGIPADELRTVLQVTQRVLERRP